MELSSLLHETSKLVVLAVSQTWAPFLVGNTFIKVSCQDNPSHTLRTISKTEKKITTSCKTCNFLSSVVLKDIV